MWGHRDPCVTPAPCPLAAGRRGSDRFAAGPPIGHGRATGAAAWTASARRSKCLLGGEAPEKRSFPPLAAAQHLGGGRNPWSDPNGTDLRESSLKQAVKSELRASMLEVPVGCPRISPRRRQLASAGADRAGCNSLFFCASIVKSVPFWSDPGSILSAGPRVTYTVPGISAPLTSTPLREQLIMAVNIFEGSRRIALLAAGLATFGALVWLVTNEPHFGIGYSIALPGGPFSRRTESCPTAAKVYTFTTNTRAGKPVSIYLCLLTMPFRGTFRGKETGEFEQQWVPYKIDEKGKVWAAPAYSSEVSEYEGQLSKRFVLPPEDDNFAEKEVSLRWWKDLKEVLLNLAIGLTVFGGVVWTVGWIVRGFLGIPRGMDRIPSEAQQGTQVHGTAGGGPGGQKVPQPGQTSDAT